MAGRIESKNGYVCVPGYTVQSNATAEPELESNPAHWLTKLDDLDKMDDGSHKEKLVMCLFSRMHRKLNSKDLYNNETYSVLLGKEAMFHGKKSLQSGRLQFEAAISVCQTEIIYIMYAQFELNRDNRRMALSVLHKARDTFENSPRLELAIKKLCDGHTDISFRNVDSCFRSGITKSKEPQKWCDDSGFDTMPDDAKFSSFTTKADHKTLGDCNMTHPTRVNAPPSPNNSLLNFSAEYPLPVTPQFRPKKIKSLCSFGIESPVTPDLSQHSKEHKTFKLAEAKDLPKHASPVLNSVKNKRNVIPEIVAVPMNRKIGDSSKKISLRPQRVLRINKIDSDDDSPQRISSTSKRTENVEPSSLPKPQESRQNAGMSDRVHDAKHYALPKPHESKQDIQQGGQRRVDIPRAVTGISGSSHSAFKHPGKFVKTPISVTDKENRNPQASLSSNSGIYVQKIEKTTLSSSRFSQNRDENKFNFSIPISVTDKENLIQQASLNNISETCAQKMEIKPVFSSGFPQNRDENKSTFGENRETLSAKAQNQAPNASQLMRDKKAVVLNGVSYVVLSLLGKGGSSKVYKVYNPATSRIAAVKQVNLTEGDQQVLDGYRNEINFLKKLRGNRHIIELLDYELRERCLYLVMECGSSDLSAFLKSRRAAGELLEAVDVKTLWKNMLRAVQAIHSHGIIHLDLKPANFMFVDFNLKLIDFGIANSIQADATSVIKDTQFGTLNYMAPETINDMSGGIQCGPGYQPKFKVGPKADVWSLGCILYYVLYGKTPFQHIHHQAMKVIAITSDNHKIDFPELETRDLVEIAQVCLIRDPKKRPSVDMLLNHPILR